MIRMIAQNDLSTNSDGQLLVQQPKLINAFVSKFGFWANIMKSPQENILSFPFESKLSLANIVGY